MADRIEGVTVDENVMIPMRDGVRLQADVYRPSGPGRFPTLVSRTPYGRQGLGALVMADYWTSHGYAVVTQDTRARFGSEGDYYEPHIFEALDGYDTIEWAAAQPWSTGSVGTHGQSYLAAVQYMVAAESPPSLKAQMPVSGSTDFKQSWIYHSGGAFEHGWMAAYATSKARDTARRLGLDPDLPELESELASADGFRPLLDHSARELPMTAWADRLSEIAPYFADYLANPDDGPHWWNINLRRRFHEVNQPMYHVGSWYDIFQEGALEGFSGITARGGENARPNQKLLMGPWGHIGYTVPTTGGCGDLDFGSVAAIELKEDQLRWFDYWLKDEDTGIMDDPPVRIFVMGDNVWREENEWPLARTVYTPWYLHSGGGANTLNGDGALSQDSPGNERPDTFVYDPNDPVPTLGGNNLITPPGVFDQTPAEERGDVLCYTSEPLSEEIEVTGPITVTLWAATSGVDTDFTAKLCDVRPDGYVQNINDGIIRARYRNSLLDQEMLTPNQSYEFTIDLWATSHVFKPGHRIRVDISSSNFPHFDRNPNTGRAIHTETEVMPAQQTVFHDTNRPSCITLPVIPR